MLKKANQRPEAFWLSDIKTVIETLKWVLGEEGVKTDE